MIRYFLTLALFVLIPASFASDNEDELERAAKINDYQQRIATLETEVARLKVQLAASMSKVDMSCRELGHAIELITLNLGDRLEITEDSAEELQHLAALYRGIDKAEAEYDNFLQTAKNDLYTVRELVDELEQLLDRLEASKVRLWNLQHPGERYPRHFESTGNVIQPDTQPQVINQPSLLWPEGTESCFHFYNFSSPQ